MIESPLSRAAVAALSIALAVLPISAQDIVELPGSDRPLSIDSFELLYAVGGLDAEPWEEFRAVNNVAFGPEGRLVLLDAQSNRIVAVSPEGEFLREVGREGEGPGEHDNASGLAVLADGRLVVWDSGKRALLLFDADGDFLEELRPDFGVGMPDDPVAMDDGTTLVAHLRRFTSSRDGMSFLTSDGVVGARDGWPILRISLDGDARLDVLARARLHRWSGTGDIPTSRAFQPWPSWGPVAGGGVAVWQSEDYRIDLLSADGQLVRTLTRPIPARELTSADRDASAADFRRRFERGQVITVGGGGGGAGTVDARIRDYLEDTWFYPRLTPILELTADRGAHVWVRRRHPNDPTRPGPVDVLATDGRYLGTLPANGPGLPAAFGPDGLVAFVVEGELDVPIMRVYRRPAGLR